MNFDVKFFLIFKMMKPPNNRIFETLLNKRTMIIKSKPNRNSKEITESVILDYFDIIEMILKKTSKKMVNQIRFRLNIEIRSNNHNQIDQMVISHPNSSLIRTIGNQMKTQTRIIK